MSAAEEHLLCERIEKLQAEVKSQNEHIELLNQCDDSSTEVIGKMDTEIEKLRSIISDVEEELDEDHCHQVKFCSGCALCIIEEGLKGLECEHQWVIADNKVVSGAEICLKCKKIRERTEQCKKKQQ